MDDFFTRRFKEALVKGPEDLDAFEYLLKAPTGGYRDLWIKQAKEAKRIADELGVATQARRVSIGDWFMWVCWIEDFCVEMVANPEYISRSYDIVNNYNKEVVDSGQVDAVLVLQGAGVLGAQLRYARRKPL